MNHEEDRDQAMLIAWSKGIRLSELNFPVLPNSKLFDFIFAVPNGGKRNKREAGRLKRQGVKAGIPDLFLALSVAQYYGMFIEMKRRKNKNDPPSKHPKTTPEQEVMLDRFKRAGYCTCVAYGFDEAVLFIEQYLSGKL